jgi:hypothetical protein
LEGNTEDKELHRNEAHLDYEYITVRGNDLLWDHRNPELKGYVLNHSRRPFPKVIKAEEESYWMRPKHQNAL